MGQTLKNSCAFGSIRFRTCLITLRSVLICLKRKLWIGMTRSSDFLTSGDLPEVSTPHALFIRSNSNTHSRFGQWLHFRAIMDAIIVPTRPAAASISRSPT